MDLKELSIDDKESAEEEEPEVELDLKLPEGEIDPTSAIDAVLSKQASETITLYYTRLTTRTYY